jgi:TP901 family phage tail tape measure protein
VDLVFKSQGVDKIKDATDKLKGVEDAAQKAGSSTKGAANGIKAFGVSARGAAGGVSALGGALQAALGPIAALSGAVGALTAAFQTIAAQDFAEAKVRTLGTNSKELVAELKLVSAELKGQASVAELTAAAYDVASAGFVKAADAAAVLKAASLGAVGGFSDINTVGNAATSVLNAYGLAASEASLVVDRFIQTQNDGKIVVAEYAQNIGKVAAAAAGLQIPLEEVNAVIAQATASGVQAEVAFTGLKSAFARLASGDANKELEGFGIKIDAASIASDGLYGTLKKLEKLDTGTLFKVLGTEAGPALLPVIQNLERFEELIKKQEGSAGAAAKANAEAANTIQGAWKAVQTELSNLFADQSELGTVLKVTLQAAAAAVKIFGQTLNVLLAPIKVIVDALSTIAKAADEAFNISATIEQANSAAQSFQAELGTIRDEFLADLAGAFEPIVELWGQAMDAIAGWWGSTTQTMGEMADGLGGWIQGVWNGIASGAQNIISPIINAFKAAFDGAWNIIMGFWNSLPGWLKGALSTAGSVVGGVASAVTNALNKVGAAVQKGIAGAGKNGAGKTAPQQIAYQPTGGGAAAPAGGGGGGKKGKGGGGGGKSGGATRESQVPALQRELQLKQELFGLEQKIAAAQAVDDKSTVIRLQGEQKLLELKSKIAAVETDTKLPAAEKALKKAILEQEVTEARFETATKLETLEADRKDRLQEMLTGFDREIELAGLKTEEAKKLLEIEHKILDLKKEGLLTSDAEIQSYRDKAQAAAAATTKDDKQSQAESDAQGIASTLTGGIKDAIKAAVTGGDVKAALSNMLASLGDRLLDMAFRPLEQMLTQSLTNMLSPAANQQMAAAYLMQQSGAQMMMAAQTYAAAMAAGGAGGFNPLGIVGSIFGVAGGAFGGGAFGSGFNPLSTTKLFPGGLFASGGSPTPGQPTIVGERGPELFVPGQSGGITNNQNLRSMMASDHAKTEGRNNAPVMNMSFETTKFMDRDWVDREQLEAAMAQTARQGAAQGERRAMERLRQSPRTRRSLGL